MAEEFELHKKSASADDASETKTQEQRQKEFEERYDIFLSQFQEACMREEAPAAIAMVLDRKYPKTPMVYKTEGDLLLLGELLAIALSNVKAEIASRLSTDLQRDPR